MSPSEIATGSMPACLRRDRFEMGGGWLGLTMAGVFQSNEAGRTPRWRDHFVLATSRRRFAELTGK